MQTFWQEHFNFGGLMVPRFMAAPLDGITDSPLRRLIRLFSPQELLFTEMRHIASVANSRVPELFAYDPVEQPLAFQISANKTAWMEEAIEKIISHGFVMINLNMGCPARTVVNSGNGSALMADIPRFKLLVTELQKTIKGRVSFTIKIRAGFKEPNGLEICQIAQDLGVDGIIIHPRLQTGGFTAPLDYKMVAAIKKHVSLPLVFSGNINSFKRAKRVYEETGVDGFMIGRALWGCPWKMKEIQQEALEIPFSLSLAEALTLAQTHLTYNYELYGEKGTNKFKKQLPQYIKGVEGASQMRSELVRLQTYQAMQEALATLHQQARGS